MLDSVRANPKASQQVLLLAHLYARTDTNALAWLRAALVKPRWGMVTFLAVVCGCERVTATAGL
jgi:hypothetical protein